MKLRNTVLSFLFIKHPADSFFLLIIDLISLSVNSDHESEPLEVGVKAAPPAVDRGEHAETRHSALPILQIKL